MTICISAIGKKKDGDEFIVFATDHMVTFGSGAQSNEFEHNIKKYKEIGLSKKTVAMLSGETLLFEKLLEGTDYLDGYDRILAKIQENFKKIKKGIIQSQLLDPFSLTEKDLKEFLIRPVENPVTRNILETIFQHKLNTGILLIGFKDGKAQIYDINEQGNKSMRDIHFHTIGSGSLQASNSLFIQKHCKDDDLKKTIYNVYKAKRNAEVAPGVGQDTEILICSKEKIVELSAEDIEILKSIYDSERRFGQDEMVKKTLNSLNDLIGCESKVIENV